MQSLGDNSMDDLLLADGFDDAIIGICERAGSNNVVAYDTDECIRILMEMNEWDREEAIENFDFNVKGSYVGEGTPVFISKIEIM